MDGFAEANLLLNSALAQLDEIIINGSKCRGPSSESGSPQPCKAEPWTAENMRRDTDEELDLESTTAHDVDDDRSTKASDWSSKGWRDQTGSDASSGVESPPSDVPTSSSSLCNPPKIYSEFLKAIEEQTLTEKPDAGTQLKIIQWLTGSCSSSPSMSTVSCPEYPEMQEKVHRLAMARDSLSLQVSVLNEQVGAQKEKIRDLEALLALKRNSLNSTEELLQDKYHYMGDCTELESKRLNLMEEVSSLKLKYATLEQQRNETEKMLKLSQNEMDHVNQSMNSMVVQKQLRSQTSSGNGQPSQLPTVKGSQGSKENEEMEQLRSTVQRLIADNEQKNHQISSLRNALDEQLRTRSHRDGYYPVSRWNEQPPYDLNTQIRLLLLEEPLEPMTHSTSFPLRLCSSTHHRDAIQPSSSFTSSLSTVSSYHSLLQTGNGHLYPSIVGTRSEQSYRSPSSPAARQLAAELDELRRISNEPHGNQPHSSTSLPRRMGNKEPKMDELELDDLESSFERLLVESDEDIMEAAENDSVFDDALVLSADKDSDTESDETLSVSDSESQDGDEWSSDAEAHDDWEFSQLLGSHDQLFSYHKAIDFYQLYLNREILSLIVAETNKQGKAGYPKFRDTNAAEIKKFIGLCIQMGVVQMPRLRDYWSSRPAIGVHSIAGKVMPRNRFEQLLSYLHFADNTHFDGNRLYKIKTFLKLFNASCEKVCRPEKEICIDESLVPFRGRVVFRQYIPSNRRKYGIKLFKLCCKGGYTWKTKIYSGRQPSRKDPVAVYVVMELMEDLLDQRRHLCTDIWYSSIMLANNLLERGTHLLGTLGKNRKGISKKSGLKN